MNILKLIGVTTDEQSIRKVEKLVEVDIRDTKGSLYRDRYQKESKRSVKQKHKDSQ